MEQNKTGKYFKYAIGEIVLVVIGILIALQINNWNEGTKHNIEEGRLLEKIAMDLISDINELEKNIRDAEDRQKKLDTIFSILYKEPNSNSEKFFILNYDAVTTESHFEVSSGTFDEGQSTGSLKFIQNDSLREQLFTYYRRAKRNYDDANTVQYIYQDIYPILYKKLMASKEGIRLFTKKTATTLPKLDIAALSKDQEYMGVLMFKKTSEIYQIMSWEKFKKDAEVLVQQIKSKEKKS